MQLSDIAQVLEAVREGRPVVVIDDEERENEADIVLAADRAQEEALSFMLREGRTVVCLALEGEQLSRIGVPMQLSDEPTSIAPNFAMSFDHLSVAGRGEEVAARLQTIKRAIANDIAPEEFVSPGFVFPLRAHAGGVLKRRGHTEASVDLVRIAGCNPSALICEVMDAQGQMLRGAAVSEFCTRHGLCLTSVEAIAAYRRAFEVSVRRVAEVELTAETALRRGPAVAQALHESNVPVRLMVYQDDHDDLEHMAIVVGAPKDAALIRVHSECLTGDVFASLRCDCGSQLDAALQRLLAEGEGVLLYLHQEGRGIGLANKMRAYKLQDEGFDTVTANEKLGFAADMRDYRVAADMLRDLGLRSVRVLTNNPKKISSLQHCGLAIEGRERLRVDANPYNKEYLATKRSRMGHLLD